MVSQDVVAKGKISQMEVQTDAQMELDAKEIAKNNVTKKTKPKKVSWLKRLFSKKNGPMGVTNISKRPINVNLSESVKGVLFILLECLAMGFLLNVMSNNFGLSISALKSLGWAVVWWLVKFKLPEVVRLYR